MNSKQRSQIIIKGMQEKKALEIVVLDLRKVTNAVSDFLVICTGNSDNQIDAIAQSVEEEFEKALKEHAWHKEGFTNKDWILLDYADVVCHIFKKDSRSNYQLEELWGDAIIEHIDLDISKTI